MIMIQVIMQHVRCCVVRLEHFVDDCLTCGGGSTHTLITNTLVYVECDDCNQFMLYHVGSEPIIGKVHKEWKTQSKV